MSEYKTLQDRLKYLKRELKNQMDIYNKLFRPYFRYEYDDYDYELLSKDGLKKLREEDKIEHSKYEVAFKRALDICGEKIKIKDILKEML